MVTVKRMICHGIVLAVLSGMLVAGCGKSETETAAPAASKPATVPLVQTATVDWCKEHSMPESICVQCHPEMGDDFKKKNDWCAEHGLPDSQCFKHHPELKAKFAADFKAKYGKEPPTETN